MKGDLEREKEKVSEALKVEDPALLSGKRPGGYSCDLRRIDPFHGPVSDLEIHFCRKGRRGLPCCRY